MEANTIGNGEHKSMGGYYLLELRPDMRSPKGRGEQAPPPHSAHPIGGERHKEQIKRQNTRSVSGHRRQDAKTEIVKMASSEGVDWFHFCRERKGADI